MYVLLQRDRSTTIRSVEITSTRSDGSRALNLGVLLEDKDTDTAGKTKWAVKEAESSGQCYPQGVRVGDVLIGINGQTLSQLGCHNVTAFAKTLRDTSKPCSLEFKMHGNGTTTKTVNHNNRLSVTMHVSLSTTAPLGMELLPVNSDGKHKLGAIKAQAATAGVLTGMEIVEVNGTSVKGLTHNALVGKLSDKSSPTLKLTLAQPQAIVSTIKNYQTQVEEIVSTTMHVHHACLIEDGFKDPEQKIEHTAGLGIVIDDTLTVTSLGCGQCKYRGVEKGFTICGINGDAVQELMEEQDLVRNAANFSEVLGKCEKPYTLNFNALPEKADESQEAFLQLMERGVEVQKQHNRGFFSKEGKRVIKLNANRDQLEVNKLKRGHGKLHKAFPADQIENIGYSANNPTQLVVQSTHSKDLRVSFPTANVSKTMTHRLYNHFVKPKYHINGKSLDTPLSPGAFKKLKSGFK
jgi:hypothetical protein